tara:strand:- start:2205 stop:2468 length:264 start_codon:yes stop_codon:yes gene_type:complete
MNDIYIKQGKIAIAVGSGYCCFHGTATGSLSEGEAQDAVITLKFSDVTFHVYPGVGGTLGHVEIYTDNQEVVEVTTSLGESDEVPEA